MKISVGSWNAFMGAAGGAFKENSSWYGKFVPVSGNTRVSVQWRDSFGIPHQTQVRWDRLQRDGSLAVLRAANGARQVALDEAAKAGKPTPRLGRAYKKADFIGATYYLSVRSDSVYV
jgi:hypothetical protein